MSVFYTDGSAHPNPGPGGFGVVEMENDKVINTYSEQYEHTTNNRMELSAILYVMENYNNIDDEFYQPPIVYSDSAYAINCFSTWIWSWLKNDWKKANGSPIENEDLMRKYIDLYEQGYRVDLQKVKGHAGTVGNELADKLATGGKL